MLMVSVTAMNLHTEIQSAVSDNHMRTVTYKERKTCTTERQSNKATSGGIQTCSTRILTNA